MGRSSTRSPHAGARSSPVRPFAHRQVLLGVTGGIASYKSVTLARRLTQAGAAVDVVLSRSAQEFVGAVTFEAVTGRAVHTELVAAGHALDHIRLARAADLVLVAPATADFLARSAQGRADDLLTATLLATSAPVVLAPAMNDRMWAHPQVGRNVAHLRALGYEVVDPAVGELAAGEGSGPGRMPEPEVLLAYAGRRLEAPGSLHGLRLVVTAGPTREAVDPVRFLSNRSSGKMGLAIAEAAWRRGADVRLVAGPLAMAVPPYLTVEHVTTTDEMCDAVLRALPACDVLIMAAAPADFRPAVVADRKVKKEGAAPGLALEPTVDILRASIPHRRAGTIVVGFALETHDLLAYAERKLEAKGLDLVVANDATEAGAGFEGDTNRVTLVGRGVAPEVLPLQAKAAVADAILDRVEALRRGR